MRIEHVTSPITFKKYQGYINPHSVIPNVKNRPTNNRRTKQNLDYIVKKYGV